MLRMANRHLFSSEFESGRAHLSMIMDIIPKRRLTSLLTGRLNQHQESF